MLYLIIEGTCTCLGTLNVNLQPKKEKAGCLLPCLCVPWHILVEGLFTLGLSLPSPRESNNLL